LHKLNLDKLHYAENNKVTGVFGHSVVSAMLTWNRAVRTYEVNKIRWKYMRRKQSYV